MCYKYIKSLIRMSYIYYFTIKSGILKLHFFLKIHIVKLKMGISVATKKNLCFVFLGGEWKSRNFLPVNTRH